MTYTASIETDAGTYQHGFHLGSSSEGVARMFCQELFHHHKPKQGTVIKSVALKQDGKMLDCYDGNWASEAKFDPPPKQQIFLVSYYTTDCDIQHVLGFTLTLEGAMEAVNRDWKDCKEGYGEDVIEAMKWDLDPEGTDKPSLAAVFGVEEWDEEQGTCPYYEIELVEEI